MSSETSMVAEGFRLQEWAAQVRECQNRPAGMSVASWCADKGQMPPATSSSEITFAEISVPLSRQEEPVHSFQEQPPAAIIKNGALSIAISNDISEALLDRIFQVIRHA